MNSKQRFLQKVIASGLKHGTMSAEDVITHADADVLAFKLPSELMAKLIKASLKAQTMSAKLIVDTLGMDALAKHVPPNVLWACISECAGRELAGDSTESDSKSKKTSLEKSSEKDDKKTKGVKGKAQAKPNAKAKLGDRKAARSDGRPPRITPVIPSSEFDVDTDVGEDWDDVDDIVEVIEADAVGAAPLEESALTDWKSDEETVSRGD